MGVGSNISSKDKEQIDEQIENSLCKIKINDFIKGAGFLCLILLPDESKFSRLIITNNKILREEDISIGKTIEILIKNGKNLLK